MIPASLWRCPYKSFIGVNRYNTLDPYGTPINGPMIQAAIAGHPIFHEYYYPKAGETAPQPKIAYRRRRAGMGLGDRHRALCR